MSEPSGSSVITSAAPVAAHLPDVVRQRHASGEASVIKTPLVHEGSPNCTRGTRNLWKSRLVKSFETEPTTTPLRPLSLFVLTGLAFASASSSQVTLFSPPRLKRLVFRSAPRTIWPVGVRTFYT